MTQPNSVDRLKALLEELFQAVRTPSGETFVVPHLPPRIPLALDSDQLQDRLTEEHYTRYRSVPSQTALNAVVRLTRASARQGPTVDIHLRYAQTGQKLRIDLADEQGRLIVVTAEGWKVFRKSSTVFRRVPGLTLPLPVPRRGGQLDEVQDFLNVTDDQWPLLLAWLLCAQQVERQQPILLLTGPYGCGKTTTAGFVKRLIDPTEASAWSMPSNPRDWRAAANAVRVIPLDNVSSLNQANIDTLCRAVTGDGSVIRRLWKDQDVDVTQLRREVIMTTVDLGSLRPDLASRTLPLDLSPLGEGVRSSHELEESFRSRAGHMLGAVLDLQRDVLRVLPDVHLSRATRLADVDSVLHTEGLSLYEELRTEQIERHVSGDQWMQALVAYVREHGTVTENCKSLLNSVTGVEPGQRPKTPEAVSARLRAGRPDLQRLGIAASPDGRSNDSGRTRLWRLTDLRG